MITILDFELITRHYRIYQEKIVEIQEVKNKAKQEILPIQNEMNNIVTQLNSDDVKNNIALEVSLNSKFKELTQKLKDIESEYSPIISEMTNHNNKQSGDFIRQIINDWARENNIDFIMSKEDVVYHKSEYECTQEILDILKEKGLFI